MSGLHWIDGAVISAYLSAMLGLGWLVSRRRESAEEYFTGGRRMHPMLVGMSLFATLMSTISYLSGPGEIIQNGPIMLAGTLAIPIGYFVVGYWLVPVFMEHRLTSAYEFLEMRLGLSTRMLGATMFIVLRLMWMAVLLNFAGRAVIVMLDLEQAWLLPVVTIVGSITMFYSSMGGLRAVVITDVAQFFLLLGGAILVILVVTMDFRGLGWFPTAWPANWQPQPVFSFDPYTRLTIVGVVIMQSLWTICTAGGDQTVIQRFMATTDAHAARRSFLVNSLAAFCVVIVLDLVGLSLMGFYQKNVDSLPVGQTLVSYADSLFPHFVAHHLPVGVSGLVVSGMFAAAMSSVDSGLNSISAVVVRDFVDRFRVGELNDKYRLGIARMTTVVVGAVVIVASLVIEYVPGNLMLISKRVTGLLMTPLFTLFLVAITMPHIGPRWTNSGAVVGFVVAVLIAFWNPLVENRSLSVTWIGPCSLAAGIVAAYSFSRFGRKRVHGN